jgi:hypothetical protein
MKTIMTLAWTISRELARENGGSAKSWLSAGLVLAWEQWKAEEALMAELEVRVVEGELEDADHDRTTEYDVLNGKLVIDGSTIETLYEHHNRGLGLGVGKLVESIVEWETPTWNVVRAWVKPWYRIHKDKAWRTVKFDEYQLEVLFRGKSVMVDYQIAKTDGLLSAVEKAGKEATGEMEELLRELWKVVRPYKVEALAREQAIKELVKVSLADARSGETFEYKDTVKGIMYDVKFRGQTVSVVKAVVLEHGWKAAIEKAAGESHSDKHKELLRGLWRAV